LGLEEISWESGGQMSDFIKETPDYLEIEGIKYAKALFQEWGVSGVDCGTLFKLLNREDTVITIQKLPDLEAENKRLREALEKIWQEPTHSCSTECIQCRMAKEALRKAEDQTLK
jgi:hypothetical protein